MANDLLSSSTRALLELFQGPLRDVRFPDADADRLDTAVDAVKTASVAVARAEAELVAVREMLAEKQRAAASETERTLAYVRIYAAERPEIRDALEALTTRPSVRRGRPKKKDAVANDESVAAAE